MTERPTPVIADITIFPIGEGTSVGNYAREAFRAMKGIKTVRLEPAAMSTTVEAANLRDVLDAVEAAHEAVLKMGAKRIYIGLRVDHRLDKPHTSNYKIKRITGQL
jgi:uncharacterized protein (TIGR00106 family)